ncbi:MAG: hypothetical protein FWG50_11665, partial [Kiritimatiellaeota bacterium]|nr:hypothetical protein [Kiritimatiellota bacterium]
PPPGRGPGGDDILAERLTATLHALKFTFVTPAGDPAADPSVAGPGQNQYTYSSARPGTFTMNLVARVEPAKAAELIAEKCAFEVSSVGISEMAWAPENPGGKPVGTPDGMLSATVTFTRLPNHNSNFGWKTARLRYDGVSVATNAYGVFFPKTAHNHPLLYGSVRTDPNWFYYWKQGGVCGIPGDSIYAPNADFFGKTFLSTGDERIHLGRRAALSDRDSPYTFTATNAAYLGQSVVAGGSGQGIQCVAETVQHENEHIYVFRQYRLLVGPIADPDGDGIPTLVETLAIDGFWTSPIDPDTFNVNIAIPNEGYYQTGDQELRCRRREMLKEITVYPERDWANPGCQHLYQYGPRVNP